MTPMKTISTCRPTNLEAYTYTSLEEARATISGKNRFGHRAFTRSKLPIAHAPDWPIHGRRCATTGQDDPSTVTPPTSSPPSSPAPAADPKRIRSWENYSQALTPGRPPTSGPHSFIPTPTSGLSGRGSGSGERQTVVARQPLRELRNRRVQPVCTCANQSRRGEEGVAPVVVATPPDHFVQQIRLEASPEGCAGQDCILDLAVLFATKLTLGKELLGRPS